VVSVVSVAATASVCGALTGKVDAALPVLPAAAIDDAVEHGVVYRLGHQRAGRSYAQAQVNYVDAVHHDVMDAIDEPEFRALTTAVEHPNWHDRRRDLSEGLSQAATSRRWAWKDTCAAA
jgi:hypothetical protein